MISYDVVHDAFIFVVKDAWFQILRE
jgi:hypothetical protein